MNKNHDETALTVGVIVGIITLGIAVKYGYAEAAIFMWGAAFFALVGAIFAGTGPFERARPAGIVARR